MNYWPCFRDRVVIKTTEKEACWRRCWKSILHKHSGSGSEFWSGNQSLWLFDMKSLIDVAACMSWNLSCRKRGLNLELTETSENRGWKCWNSTPIFRNLNPPTKDIGSPKNRGWNCWKSTPIIRTSICPHTKDLKMNDSTGKLIRQIFQAVAVVACLMYHPRRNLSCW